MFLIVFVPTAALSVESWTGTTLCHLFHPKFNSTKVNKNIELFTECFVVIKFMEKES